MTDKILRADLSELANVKSCVFKESVNSGEYLRFGAAVARSIELSAYGAQTDAPTVGEVLTYYQTDDNGVDTLIGTFIAQPSIPSKNSYSIVAYDNISLLETDFSEHLANIQGNFPMSVADLLDEVESVAGVTFGNSPAMSAMTVEELNATGITCRNVVEWVAEVSGQYVICDTNGDILFDWYSAVSGEKVYIQSGSSGGISFIPYKQGGLDYKDFAVSAVDAVAVFPPEVEGAAAIYPNTTGNIYSVRDNLLLSGASAATLSSVAQGLYTVLSALPAYRPCRINLFRGENPLRAGDIVDVEDAQGVTFKTLVMSMTVATDGVTVECTGRETYDADGGSTYNSQLANLASNIVRINKLKVDWADINTAIINYLTTNNVTAQNLTIVDAADNVLATFNASGITLGDPASGHAEVDFNSFELYDKDGNLYASIGDLRDSSGVAEMVYFAEADGTSDTYSFYPPTNDTSTAKVYVSGVEDTGATFTSDEYSSSVTLSFVPEQYKNIRIEYTTTNPSYHYDLGFRAQNTPVGYYSVAMGYAPLASGTFSSVCGGGGNSSYGKYSFVGGGYGNFSGSNGEANAVVGGYSNSANGGYSIVGGGQYNEAVGLYSGILSGYLNSVSADGSVIVGGRTQSISGVSSFILGGDHNDVSGNYATVWGSSNKVSHNNQTTFGKYNLDDAAYAESVGNGTSPGMRSNARTLDWSGNETLAGTLYINGNENVGCTHITSGSANLNNYTTPGLYYFSTAVTLTNQPSGFTYGWLRVIANATGTIIRQYFADGYTSASVFTRRYYSSWTSWIESVTEDFASTATPQPLGTAAAGSSKEYARADHVHPKPSLSDLGTIRDLGTRYSIPQGTSQNFSIPNNSQWVLFSNSRSTSGRFILIVNGGSDGTVTYTRIGETGATIATATNRITITTPSSSYYYYVVAIEF